jgi:hypothetical protein
VYRWPTHGYAARGGNGRLREGLSGGSDISGRADVIPSFDLFLQTINLATDLPRFVQEHLSINPAALRRREIHLAKESS